MPLTSPPGLRGGCSTKRRDVGAATGSLHGPYPALWVLGSEAHVTLKSDFKISARVGLSPVLGSPCPGGMCCPGTEYHPPGITRGGTSSLCPQFLQPCPCPSLRVALLAPRHGGCRLLTPCYGERMLVRERTALLGCTGGGRTVFQPRVMGRNRSCSFSSLCLVA